MVVIRKKFKFWNLNEIICNKNTEKGENSSELSAILIKGIRIFDGKSQEIIEVQI